MVTVTVYSFEVSDIREGDFVLAKGKATLETIESLNGRVVEHTAQTIDEAFLNETGRYHDNATSKSK